MEEPNFKSKKIIGILGYGRFGQLLAKVLAQVTSETHQVIIFSRRVLEVEEPLQTLPMSELNKVDVLIPCVPIAQFETVIKTIVDQIKPDCVMIDVCSVKVYPIESMKKSLPSTVEIIGTHPIFGPDSYKKNNGLKGMPIVLVNVRSTSRTFDWLKSVCLALELNMMEMTAEQHDKYAAFSQAYAFLIGKIGQRLDIQSTPIDTMWYRLLLEERHAIEHDSEQLFFDIQNRNPFTAEMREKFLTVTENLFTEINERKSKDLSL